MFYYLFISINSVMCALITIDILLSIFRYSVQYFCAIFTYCIGHLTKFLYYTLLIYLITGYLLHLLHDNLHFPSSKFNAKMSISIIACETFKTHAYWSWAKLILNVIPRKCEKNKKEKPKKKEPEKWAGRITWPGTVRSTTYFRFTRILHWQMLISLLG